MMFQGYDSVPVLNKRLPRKLYSGEICYTFPQHLIFLEDGIFKNTRSGPNWQGSLLTLTTCKHKLRTYLDPIDFLDVWFAGFTPKINSRNYLLFLAKPEKVFTSMHDISMYVKRNYPRAFKVKNATDNPLGDLYVPGRSCRAYAYKSYKLPHPNHVRRVESYKDGTPKWHRDIKYLGNKGRPHAMFIMGEQYVFSRPMYYVNRELYRSGFKCHVQELLEDYLVKV